MKKHIKTILILTFVAALSFFAYQIVTKINHKKEVAKNIKTIPIFSYENTDSGSFTNKNLKYATPTLFVYFNSECEYCNEEAEMVKENIEKFQNIQVIFISFEQPELIKTFSAKHKLNTHNNIHFLHDSKVTFATTFDVKSLPCLVLYDKNKKLIEKIKGQTKTEILLKKLTSQ